MNKEKYLKPSIKLLLLKDNLLDGIRFSGGDVDPGAKPYLDTDMWDSENGTDDNSPGTGGSVWGDETIHPAPHVAFMY